jgi:hypothetical protein
MDDTLSRIAEDLAGRLHGPLTMRLLLQPLMALLLGAHAGLSDARAGRPPYSWSLLNDPLRRPALIREGARSIGKVFAAAIVLDGIYQMIVLRWFYPGEAIIVATVLAIVPYLLVRGIVRRVVPDAGATAKEPGRQ